jgi:hypothetical protein
MRKSLRQVVQPLFGRQSIGGGVSEIKIIHQGSGALRPRCRLPNTRLSYCGNGFYASVVI